MFIFRNLRSLGVASILSENSDSPKTVLLDSALKQLHHRLLNKHVIQRVGTGTLSLVLAQNLARPVPRSRGIVRTLSSPGATDGAPALAKTNAI